MNFYEYFFCTMINFIALYTRVSRAGNKNLVVTKRGLEAVTPCSVGLVLFAKINNTSDNVDFDVEVIPDRCCLEMGSEEDCDVIEIIGECVERIPRGTTKTVRLVAPLIDAFERRGVCTVHLNSKSKTRQRKVMRNVIKIPFDTRLKNIEEARQTYNNVYICNNIDEDPLDDCKPVDCVSYYNGKRSFFDSRSKRCVNVPLCISNINDDVPNTIYDVKKNQCIVGDSITEDDMKLIKELTGEVKARKAKDILIIKSHNKSHKIHASDVNDYHRNLSRIINNDNNKLFTKLKDSSFKIGNKAKFEYFFTKYVTSNKCTFLVFAVVILVQCILICSMIYCLTRSCNCQKKKVVRQLFNYRQDASVTTPLICTSNVDTETTEYRYFGEQSNIDNKIKCYKACQKQGKNNAKMSMSDDIISKCLNRRDWNSKLGKPRNSENIDRNETKSLDIRQEEESDSGKPSLILNDTVKEKPSKCSNAKVNFVNEMPISKEDASPNNIINNIVKKIENKTRISKVYEQFQGEVSEMEIKCHSYNYGDVDSNKRAFTTSTNNKKLGFFRSDKKKSGAVSVSTEKGAQATFSNDSLDDFLLERGMSALACEDLSKYSFSSPCNAKKSSLSSELSSGTSKSNVVKNVISLFHRRSKNGPSSDPGSKKPGSNLNMQLMPISNASVYSSSNNDSDYLKNFQKPKDSRSSL